MRTDFLLPRDEFAIVATLDAINGPASFTVITTAEPLLSAIRRAEMMMNAQGIAPAERIGARVHFTSAAGSRKASPVTAATIRLDADGWRVTELRKKFVAAGTRESFALDLFDHNPPGAAFRNEVPA